MNDGTVERAPQRNLFRFFRTYTSYTRYWIATVITRFGDSLDSIAYMWLVLDLTKSPLAMGSIMVANLLPNIILGPFTGVLADRYNRKWLVVWCDALRGLLVMGIAALVFAGHIRIWMLYVTTVLGSVLESIQAPARSSITPSVVSPADLMSANSMNGLSESVAQLVGLAAAGAIIALVRTAGAIAIDALTFWISAAIMASLRLPSGDRKPEPLNIKGFFSELAEGLKYIGQSRAVLLCIILGGLTNFFLGPLNVLLPVFVKLELQVSAAGLAQAFLIETAAVMVGSILVSGTAKRIGETWTMRLGFFLLSFGYMLLFFARSIGSTMVFLVVLGLGVPFASAGFRTIMQKNTPLEKMGRVSAVSSTLLLAAMPLSTALSGALGERFAAPHLFGALGCMVLISTLSLTFNRALRSSRPAPPRAEAATE